MGISFAHTQWLNHDIFKLNNFKNEKLIRRITWPGKHSLVIYLIHQPLLFSLLAPIYWWLN
ncbi:MAG: heparan-alpha-glucosaminide N-acetyltransferase domain-containing protein [Colwellia polaris]|uniref:heparan-alpha-glucosaminide N-acetyltransferase domain-containing protein n=1 Tax=Colwellia polaris TaxID=326537 RepID=UPI001E583574|nr:heparan-alpha-glucosaminide N-acetyltransferase domain-containing protein [Colwellia polaris]